VRFLATLSLALCLPAMAEPVFVGVAARGAESGLTERARARVAELLEDRAEDVSSARDATTDESAVQEVRRRVQTARALFLEVDFDGALTELDEALVVFEDGAAYSAGESFRDVLAEMLMLRAVILARLGRDPEMRATLARLVSALPTYRPDPGEVPPAIVREHSKLRKTRKGRLKLVVKSSPSGDVTLDGIERGQAPITLDKLVPGIHYLSVRGEGEVFRRVIRLRDKKTRVSVTLGDPRVAAARVIVAALEGGLDDQDALGGMLAPLGEDVIAGVIEGPTLLLGRVEGGAVSRVLEVPIVPTTSSLGIDVGDMNPLYDPDPRLDDTRLGRWLGRPEPELPDPELLPPEEEGGSPALLIGGVVLGVVVVAAAATGAAVLLTPPPPAGFQLGVEFNNGP
jgi:hypothetical protein